MISSLTTGNEKTKIDPETTKIIQPSLRYTFAGNIIDIQETKESLGEKKFGELVTVYCKKDHKYFSVRMLTRWVVESKILLFVNFSGLIIMPVFTRKGEKTEYRRFRELRFHIIFPEKIGELRLVNKVGVW